MGQGIDWIRESGIVRNKRLLCLVDGEHYPPVLTWAIEELRGAGAEIAGLLFLGGTEKIKNPESALPGESTFFLKDLRSPAKEIDAIAAKSRPDAAVDLSDDPVVLPADRIRLASCFLSLGVSYLGADFSFSPPEKKQQLAKPSLRIWGTNKRVGKTALTVYAAEVLKRNGYDPAIVSMGRGGPEKPEVILPEELSLSPGFLLDKAMEGMHAASDCWEDAVLAQVPTVGCRRCGGGMAGNPFISNVHEGVEIVNGLDCNIVIMEGSGPTSPPVETDASVLIVSARIPPAQSVDFFGSYRILDSDLILITMCTGGIEGNKKVKDGRALELYRRIKAIRSDVPVGFTGFRIRPAQDISGKKVFVATTVSKKEDMAVILEELEREFKCTVTGFSINLSNREQFLKDMETALEQSDLLLTELKASSIDVGAKYAKKYGKDIVFLHNRPVLLGGDFSELENAVLALIEKANVKNRN